MALSHGNLQLTQLLIRVWKIHLALSSLFIQFSTCQQHEHNEHVPHKDKVVIVIGAGTAGLAAARYLQDCGGYNVTVLDANSRYGGRIWTYEHLNFPGRPLEMGAMWLYGGESETHAVAELCRQSNIPLKEFDFNVDKYSYFVGEGTTTGIPVEDVDEKFSQLEEVLANVSKTYYEDRTLSDVPLFKALKNLFPEWISKLQEMVYRYIVVPFIEESSGAETSKLSYGGDYIREDIFLRFPPSERGLYSMGLLFWETRWYNAWKEASTTGGKDLVIPSGYMWFLERLVNGNSSIGQRPLEVSLNKEVTEVKLDNSSERVTIITATDDMYFAHHVVVAVPLGVLKAGAISFDPPLPAEQKTAIARMGFGNYVKIFLVFEARFWPSDVRWFTIKSDPPGSLFYFVSLVNAYGINALVGVSSGSAAYEADKLTDDQLERKALDALSLTFGSSLVSNSHLLFSKRTKWSTDPFFRGSYSYPLTGLQTEDLENIRKPLGSRIFFAGEHTNWAGQQEGSTVLGAYKSGLKTAQDIAGEPLASNAIDMNPLYLVTINLFVLLCMLFL